MFWLQRLAGDSWAELLPITTKTDGNCLCHAASLFVYGHQDHQLELRCKLYEHMMQNKDAFFCAYVSYQDEIDRNLSRFGIDLSSMDREKEFEDVLSYIKPVSGNIQKSLEPFHIFGLADLLCRTIIVYAKSEIDENPSNFPGFYVPSMCDKPTSFMNPILMVYDQGHTRALLINSRCKEIGANQLTLKGDDGKYMPIRFPYFDNHPTNLEFDINEPGNKIKMLSEYMNLEQYDGVSFVRLNFDGM